MSKNQLISNDLAEFSRHCREIDSVEDDINWTKLFNVIKKELPHASVSDFLVELGKRYDRVEFVYDNGHFHLNKS